MKSGGVSTSGMLTLRDAPTMTLDPQARLAGRGRPELDRVSAPASGRRMTSRGPRASRASVTCVSVLMAHRPGPAGAVDQVLGQAHSAAAPPAGDRPSSGRQGYDLRLSAPCPIRVQTGAPRARFRWSGPGGATPSGAVSAGSNPAGGTTQKHKFEQNL